jgi:predicted ATPase
MVQLRTPDVTHERFMRKLERLSPRKQMLAKVAAVFEHGVTAHTINNVFSSTDGTNLSIGETEYHLADLVRLFFACIFLLVCVCVLFF